MFKLTYQLSSTKSKQQLIETSHTLDKKDKLPLKKISSLTLINSTLANKEFLSRRDGLSIAELCMLKQELGMSGY